MICPNCNFSSKDEELSCSQCGYNLNLFKEFHALKKDTENITQNLNSNFRKLEQLTFKYKKFETDILQYLKLHSKRKEDIILPTPATSEPDKIIEKIVPDSSKKVIPPKQNYSEIQLGQKWLLIIGIIILVLGIGYFLKYSFDKNWISPSIRVTGVFLSGAGLLFAGEYFRKKLSQIFGLYLTGGGIATLYFASYAGSQIYHLMGQIPCFILMILITGLTCALSLFYNTKWLSFLGLIGGFLTPIILSTGHDAQLALMTYMVLLNSGILFISIYKQWGLLNNWGFTFTWLLYSGWYERHYTNEKFVISFLFMNIFFLIYAVIPFVFYFLKERKEKLKGLTITVFNAFIAFGFAYNMVKPIYGTQYLSLLTIAYAALYIYMAQFIIKKGMQNIEPIALLIGKASLFLIITIPLLFSGHWITIFWVVQSGVLFWIALKLKNFELYKVGYALLIISFFKLGFYDYPEIFKFRYAFGYFQKGFNYLLVERLINSFVALWGLLIIAKMVQLRSQKKEISFVAKVQWQYLYSFLGIFLFLILNIEVSGFFKSYLPKATFASISVLWTCFAIAIMALGFFIRISVLRKCALSLFALTILKIFFKDMANVSTPFRILSFLILGVMLILASYFYYRFKDRIEPSKSQVL